MMSLVRGDILLLFLLFDVANALPVAKPDVTRSGPKPLCFSRRCAWQLYLKILLVEQYCLCS